jgi:hypothetical protein
MMNPLFTATVVDDRRSALHTTADRHRLAGTGTRDRGTRWLRGFLAVNRKKTCQVYEAPAPTRPRASAPLLSAAPASR